MRFLTSFLLLLSTAMAFSQIAPSRYWVQFTDKNNSPYSISDPSQFLSQRALDRRNAQGIAIEQNDIPVNQFYIDSVSNAGAEILNRSRWFNAVTIAVQDSSVLLDILNFPFVMNVQAVALLTRPDDELDDKFREWRESSKTAQFTPAVENADYGEAFNQIDMLTGISLHAMGYRGEGMQIAVLDAGFINTDSLLVFDSLRTDGRILGSKDFVEGDLNVYGHSTHGTAVLSTMAANIPGLIIGTAPDASYWLLRSEDTGSEYLIEEDNWVAAAEFADSVGADIINSSLSYTTFNDSTMDHDYADLDGNTTRVTRGADIAANKGILVVASAGNYGNGPWKYIGAPADGDSVLAIGAVDEDEMPAPFTSRGPSADARVKPNVAAQGQNSTIVDVGSGNPVQGNGTSFSGPIIAGMTACLWQANPDLTNMQVFRAIEQSAHQYHDPDTLWGYGIPNFARAHLMLTGIEVPDVNNDELVKVFPNPFQDKLTADFYSAQDQWALITLSDLTGKVIYRKECVFRRNTYTSIGIDELTDLGQGVYIFAIQSLESVYYKKLVKR